MTKITNDWKCGQSQGQQLTVEQICYVVDKSFYGLGSQDNKYIAAAICLAESSGYTGAVGDCNLGFSLGLWQIHVPDWKTTIQYGGDVFNAYDNAAMAAVVYEHNKFHNWSTYNGGQYQSYMAEVKAAWPNRSKPGTVATTSNTNPGGSALPGNAGKAVDAAAGVVTGTVNATESTAQAIGKVGEGIGKAAVWTGNPHNWLRVAYVALGTAVVIAGLVKLTGLRGVTPLAVAANAAKPKAQPVTKKAEREEASSDD